MAHEIKVEVLKRELLEQKLSKCNYFPTLIKLNIHEIPIEQILRKGFLHIGLEGGDISLFTVEVKLLEPAIDKLREARILSLI